MATRAGTGKPPTDEQGYSQQTSWGGIVSGFDEDYADAWRMPTRWTTTEKMATDPAVASSLAALTYPVLAAQLEVEPASDDPKDRELAEFIEGGLANMTIGLQRHRMEALGCVGEGVRVFETVFERREDGYWHLRKLALRPNKTIATWHVDDTGGPDGVTQNYAMSTMGAATPEKLQMDRLLVFTHLGDGPSLLGRPAMRAMYRPWWLIDKVSRIGAIALERHGVGVPWARYIGGSDTEAKRIDRALMGLHANEMGYLRVDDQVPEWGVKGVEGAVMDPVPFMEYQRRDLFLASLAQFLALGTDGVGSLALSGDQSGFFMLAVRSIASEIEDVYNRHLVPRWIGYNWTVGADHLPRVKHGTIDQRSATDWATAVAQVVAAGITLPADELTRTAARLLGVTIPEAPDEPAPDVQDVNDPNAPKTDDDGARVNQRAAWAGVDLATGAAGQPQRDLKSPTMLEALGIAPDWARMSTALDGGRDAIIEKVTALQEKQARRLAKLGTRLVKAGDADRVARLLAGEQDAFSGLDLATANRPKRLVSYDEEADAFAAEMYGLFDQGIDEYGNEISQQGVEPVQPGQEERDRRRELLFAGALVAAALLADRMQNAWAAEVFRQFRVGPDQAALQAATAGLSGKLLESLASQRANEALATGRALVGEANADAIKAEIWTAVMDQWTCRGRPTKCWELDGQEFAVGEGPPCPNPDCDGGDRCRCERVPVVDK